MRRYVRISAFTMLALALLLVSSSSAVAWDREDAKDYAQTYALSQNPNFVYISGADCANFVSQSIWDGGIAMDSDWYYDFAYDICSYYWSTAPAFHNYFKESPRTHDYRYLIGTYDFDDSTSRPRPPHNVSTMLRGDMVSYDWDLNGGSDWTIDHVAIITGLNAHSTYDDEWQGDLRCQHSNDRYREAWQCGDRHSSTYMQDWGFAAWGLLNSLD
jgi:hypothetical protein